ncbi:E3 ubiquitin-protein ligase [Cricetulus griseus]|nr:E3 ubiquitin-protein ligase [Cricetulus griseus]
MAHTPEKGQRLAKRGFRSLGTGVTDSCEPPCQCWELNPGPLQELTSPQDKLPVNTSTSQERREETGERREENRTGTYLK